MIFPTSFPFVMPGSIVVVPHFAKAAPSPQTREILAHQLTSEFIVGWSLAERCIELSGSRSEGLACRFGTIGVQMSGLVTVLAFLFRILASLRGNSTAPATGARLVLLFERYLTELGVECWRSPSSFL